MGRNSCSPEVTLHPVNLNVPINGSFILLYIARHVHRFEKYHGVEKSRFHCRSKLAVKNAVIQLIRQYLRFVFE